jgi:predicted exporter
MTRWAARAWLVMVLVIGAYLGLRANEGLELRTDLLALLPKVDQEPILQRANDQAMRIVSRTIALLVGSHDRTAAVNAAREIESALKDTDFVVLRDWGDERSGPRALGAFYFPYRAALLSEADRQALMEGHAAAIAQRALAQTYGVGGFVDAKLLAADPFLLFPSFLTSLPTPTSRLTFEEGRLRVVEDGITWILVSGRMTGDPYDLKVQDQIVQSLNGEVAALTRADRTLVVKRTGAVFFARAGAQAGLVEASMLGSISVVGTIALLLLAFRHPLPLVLNVVTLLIGTGAALAGTLVIFGEIHIMTLLFGVGLIGVAVDYGLHYSASVFDSNAGSRRERLRHVLPAITLGLLTTMIGYVILALAPFPGLRQIAVFSTFGLVAAFLTVVLWFPLFGDAEPPRSKDTMMCWAEAPWLFWRVRRFRPVRWIMIAALAGLGIVGLWRLDRNDDVRRLQSLSHDLVTQQADIQRLSGLSGDWQSVLVTAADDEQALRIQEDEILSRMAELVKRGAISGYQAPANYVPSVARQRENARLIEDQLMKPLLAQYRTSLGLTAAPEISSPPGVLTLDAAIARGVAPFLGDLVLAPGQHLVALQGVRDPDAVRAALRSVPQARFVDPTSALSQLLEKYHQRAIWLIGVSAILMVFPLWWRYGLRGALIVMAPGVGATILAPALIALSGEEISFFHIMALMIVLSLGVDFAIFCAERSVDRRSSASLAVVLAAMTTLLSFGVLAFSQVFAVHAFGLTLLLGILIAFILAPVALQIRPIVRSGA